MSRGQWRLCKGVHRRSSLEEGPPSGVGGQTRSETFPCKFQALNLLSETSNENQMKNFKQDIDITLVLKHHSLSSRRADGF